MQIAAAVATSEHPVPAHAVAECAGALLEQSPEGFDEVLCVVGTPFGGALGEIASALGELLAATNVAGIESRGLLMGARVAEGTAALAVFGFRGAGIALGHCDGSETPAVSTRGAALRLLLADPFSSVHASSTRSGPLPGAAEVSLAGGYVVGGRAAGRTSMFLGTREHIDGALHIDADPRCAQLHLLHGTRAIARQVVVTEVSGTQVVALDDLPAGELFESFVLAAGEQEVVGATEIGFTAGDGRLVAARRSPSGLETSAPLDPGTVVTPSVRSSAAAGAQLSAALQSCGRGAALVLLDERLGLGLREMGYTSAVADLGTRVAGLVVAGILWGDAAGPQLVGPAALVVGFVATPPAGGVVGDL